MVDTMNPINMVNYIWPKAIKDVLDRVWIEFPAHDCSWSRGISLVYLLPNADGMWGKITTILCNDGTLSLYFISSHKTYILRSPDIPLGLSSLH